MAAVVRGGAKKPLAYRPLGMLACLGRRSAVAEICGLQFSGFFAWWLWRTIYLFKLPGLERKVRVAMDWTLDLFFPRDIVLLKVFMGRVTKMTTSGCLLLALALLSRLAALQAAPAKDVTITGELIDSACYVRMGARGMDHKECAVSCAKAGIPLAILEDKTAKVYLLASDKDLESANVKFQPLEKFVARRVVVKGKLYERGGQQLLSASVVALTE